MTLLELYQSQKNQGALGKSCRALLEQTHWFMVNAEFDPKTGEALPQALSSFLSKVAREQVVGTIHDRLWRITDHVRSSIERLFHSLYESPRREQALMPVHAVRELDANSFIKLSNRPGRNIREKLAGKPYLQAVRRFQSVNLPENRLLKAFVSSLADLLESRRNYLGEEEDELLPKIQSWLRSAEAQAIARWDNLPPNNTLLSHRDYRRVWDAWRWLQTLDDDIAGDFSKLEARDKTIRIWNEFAQMWAEGGHLFAEMPILFDYQKFEIRPWLSRVAVQKAPRKVPRHFSAQEFSEPVCVDLTVLRPRFAAATKGYQALRAAYLWQHWINEDESVDIELFHSDAVHVHPDATSIASSDLFFSKDNTSEHFDRAARSFSSKLQGVFKSDTLIWLVPDFLNDFELEVPRRNLNARFRNAEPLPRSVAAAFEQVDYSKIKRDGYSVVVVDAIGGKTCATKLLARLDPELRERLPESGGFYWERCPSVIIASDDAEKLERKDYDLTTVDYKGQWRDATRPVKPQPVNESSLKSDSIIGQFEISINLAKSPVAGGIHLHGLQQRAGDIPLWRDQIPELSIKAMKDGSYQRFHLVSRGTTVKPARNQPVRIPVDKCFTLPPGRLSYQFPLYIGENSADLGFSARLDSPAFPLKKNVACNLNLIFEYGADEPYKLVFSPTDNSFPPIRATWRRTEEVIITDAPAPEYPAPMTWDDLRRFPDSKNGGTMDLIAKMIETSANFARWIERNDEKAWNNIENSIKGWCRFLVISIWRDGRAASEALSPWELRRATEHFQSSLKRILAVEEMACLDVRFLESCMHKEAPEECIQWITEQVENSSIRDVRAVGFALGDVSERWQEYALSKLVTHPTNNALRVFAYAIWREQNFVEKFALSELQEILTVLQKVMIQATSAAAWPLELLLGLLRTRSSSDPEVRMLLQPHQKITKELAKQVERMTEIVAQSTITLFSRVQIKIPKPEGDRTPDLLYALRLYLAGDDGANAIHITSISDND